MADRHDDSPLSLLALFELARTSPRIPVATARLLAQVLGGAAALRFLQDMADESSRTLPPCPPYHEIGFHVPQATTAPRAVEGACPLEASQSLQEPSEPVRATSPLPEASDAVLEPAEAQEGSLSWLGWSCTAVVHSLDLRLSVALYYRQSGSSAVGWGWEIRLAGHLVRQWRRWAEVERVGEQLAVEWKRPADVWEPGSGGVP